MMSYTLEYTWINMFDEEECNEVVKRFPDDESLEAYLESMSYCSDDFNYPLSKKVHEEKPGARYALIGFESREMLSGKDRRDSYFLIQMGFTSIYHTLKHRNKLRDTARRYGVGLVVVEI